MEKAEQKEWNLWEIYDDTQLQELEKLNEAYKAFLDAGKTERECVTEIVRQAEAAGYRDLYSMDAVKAGDKVYATWMEKSIALFHVGSEPLEQGMNILGAHIDSPRLDLKQNPLYEDSGFAYFDTHYYGGIKKYQWVTIPLAIHGVVVKKTEQSCRSLSVRRKISSLQSLKLCRQENPGTVDLTEV